MAKRKPNFSTVVSFMSEEAQAEMREKSGISSTLALGEIRPDPEQPRSLLPADLAKAVTSGALLPAQVVQEWMARAEQDRLSPAQRQNLIDLRQLSDNIANHGLINPISVRRGDGPTRYTIVTGERRYWAHVILAAAGRQIHEGEKVLTPTQIKAQIVVDGISVRAHQLIENVMRKDINAVEKAQGLVALRKEMEVSRGSPVTWDAVSETVGMSKRHRIRLTSVLKLGQEALEFAADHNFQERTIRPIVQKLRDAPELQMKALRHLAELETKARANRLDGSVSAALEAYIGRLLKKPAAPKASRQTSRPQPLERFQQRLQKTIHYLDQLSEQGFEATPGVERHAMVNDLQALRTRINELLTKLLER